MALASALVTRLSSLHRATPHDDTASVMSEGSFTLSSRALTRPRTHLPSRATDAAPSLGVSSVSSSFDSLSCNSEPSCLTEASGSMPRPRQNEHLAVLLSKRLWKPDSQAAHCDTFMCRRPFSIWERRHHCRKCGGVFCGDCSNRTTTLLDASKLEFLHPPRNVPIQVYDSPISPVLECRVCNDCFDQIHGCKTPRSPVMSKASPIALVRSAETSSGPSSVSSSVDTPPEGAPINSITPRPALRRTHTSPRIPTSPLRSNTPIPQSNGVLIVDSELSLGELDSYPLRRASKICKATGGGRWEPKQVPEYVAKRIPGCKAAYELELEREEEERRIRRANPIIRNGGQLSPTRSSCQQLM
ncbi:FYVE zinc finger-domain-containing protein [Dichomitus squalens]|uniref:FYVE zinc finger-domain-containing protein n=1 Tax=Dichomitus squalens TaxID=114155 RepID=A0A4Q9MTA7_9APHY|nr:FYVE zinc finger-domain-containing protein [Dichomitus squalens]